MRYQLFGFKKGELGESSDLYYADEKEKLFEEELEDFKEDFPCVIIRDIRNKLFDVIQNIDGYSPEEIQHYFPGFKRADLLTEKPIVEPADEQPKTHRPFFDLPVVRSILRFLWSPED